MWVNNWFIIYPNYPGGVSFSTNHVEPGEHIRLKDPTLSARRAAFRVPLLVDRTLYEEMLPKSPLESLLLVDLYGKRVLNTSTQLVQALTSQNGSDNRPLPPPCKMATFEAQRKRRCERFSPRASERLASTSGNDDGITVIIGPVRHSLRLAQFVVGLLAQSNSSHVHRVIVLLLQDASEQHKYSNPVQMALVARADVRIVSISDDAMSPLRRYFPTNLVTTRAVVLVDANWYPSLDHIAMMHAAFIRLPQRIIGLTTTAVPTEALCGYDHVSAGVMMMHRDMLFLTTCGDKALPTPVQASLRAMMNTVHVMRYVLHIQR
jgi:hypothetical protein